MTQSHILDDPFSWINALICKSDKELAREINNGLHESKCGIPIAMSYKDVAESRKSTIVKICGVIVTENPGGDCYVPKTYKVGNEFIPTDLFGNPILNKYTHEELENKEHEFKMIKKIQVLGMEEVHNIKDRTCIKKSFLNILISDFVTICSLRLLSYVEITGIVCKDHTIMALDIREGEDNLDLYKYIMKPKDLGGSMENESGCKVALVHDFDSNLSVEEVQSYKSLTIQYMAEHVFFGDNNLSELFIYHFVCQMNPNFAQFVENMSLGHVFGSMNICSARKNINLITKNLETLFPSVLFYPESKDSVVESNLDEEQKEEFSFCCIYESGMASEDTASSDVCVNLPSLLGVNGSILIVDMDLLNRNTKNRKVFSDVCDFIYENKFTMKYTNSEAECGDFFFHVKKRFFSIVFYEFSGTTDQAYKFSVDPSSTHENYSCQEKIAKIRRYFKFLYVSKIFPKIENIGSIEKEIEKTINVSDEKHNTAHYLHISLLMGKALALSENQETLSTDGWKHVLDIMKKSKSI